jgi:preprotein translocase subunit YajC
VENLPNLVLLALALALLVLVLTRGRSRAQALRQAQDSLKPGQQVMTASGLFARVVEVGPEVVVLETGPGQRSRWDRRVVVRVIPDESTEQQTANGTRDEQDETGAA